MQLAPVNGSPSFSSFDDIHWHGSLNGAVFLDQGNHRFRDDPEWGEILQQVQADDDISRINKHLLREVQLLDLVDCSESRIVYVIRFVRLRGIHIIIIFTWVQYQIGTLPFINVVSN